MQKTGNTHPVYDYFYGEETLQFSFYRVPKLLVTSPEFKNLSNDAKILYGLLLDRTTLSMKNGWVDEYNRVYVIYTVENIMADLNIGTGKAVKTLKLLEDYHLVSKKRLGQGHPTRLYVHNFFKGLEFQNFENRNSKPSDNGSLEFSTSNFLNFDKMNSAFSNNESLDFQKDESNNTNIINNDINNINPSNQSGEYSLNDKMDAYIQIIKENINYDIIKDSLSEKDKSIFEELFNIMCDIICIKRNNIRINGIEYPYSIVKSVYLKLNHEHLLYVIESLNNTTTTVTNIRNYMISALYNSYSTIDTFYNQKINEEKRNPPD